MNEIQPEIFDYRGADADRHAYTLYSSLAWCGETDVEDMWLQVNNPPDTLIKGHFIKISHFLLPVLFL